MKIAVGGRGWALGVIVCVALAPIGLRNANGQDASAGSGAELSGAPVYSEVWQARMPRVCAKLTRPPKVAQAIALAQCNGESASKEMLYLMSDIKVELGKPREFEAGPDMYWQDIDPAAKIIPILGSATKWICARGDAAAPGTNCMRWEGVKDTPGRCWKTLSGEYKCSMASGGGLETDHVAGPRTY